MLKEGYSCLGHINHFYRIDNRDDELSRSRNGSIESGSAITLHCTENLHSCEARTRAVDTAVCPANHLAIMHCG